MNFTNKGNKATRFGFGEGVVALANRDNRIVVLGGDITNSVGLGNFAKQFPNRFFSMGIAEQNSIGVAAGLAHSGKIPFFSTYAVFSAHRDNDQIRISVCYNNLPVKIGGAHAGISVGADGATHQALEDIAVMRVLPNMTVLSPCDATQTKLATIASVEQVQGPAYIRYGREPIPDFTTEDLDFEVGKVQVFRQGKDVSIFATGSMVWEALQAAEMLTKKNVDAEVINVHTIKPIDVKGIIQSVKKTYCTVVAEEHQTIGGLGSAVAEVCVQHFPVPIEFVGIQDQFGESGNPDELMKKYGLTAENIAKKVLQVIQRKNKI
ncbi:MAG: transketolase family protein [Bacteroidales bacterium]|nr:transketolase family protein [Bacteroidales bacterium]